MSPWRRRGGSSAGGGSAGGEAAADANASPPPAPAAAPDDLDALLQHQSSPLRRPLLNQGGGSSSDAAPAARTACAAFRTLLALCGDAAPAGTPALAGPARLGAARSLVCDALSDPGLRDEIFMQAVKQTRGNPSPASTARAWEVLAALASATPPGPDFAVLVAEYVHASASVPAVGGGGEDGANPDVERSAAFGLGAPTTRALARRAWAALKRSTRAGPRARLPSLADIAAALDGTPLRTTVAFLGGATAQIAYQPSASVLDAVEAAAAAVGLAHHTTFTLFTVGRAGAGGAVLREVGGGAPDGIVHTPLPDDAYLADGLAGLGGEGQGEGPPSSHQHPQNPPPAPALLFKKRLFRDTDASAAASDPVFVSLAYTQSRHDYLAGLYPVARGDAAALAAWQVVAESAGRGQPDPTPLASGDAGADAVTLAACIPPALLATRPMQEWLDDVRPRAAAAAAAAGVGAAGADPSILAAAATAARRTFMSRIRDLPYGNALFFPITFSPADQAPGGGGGGGASTSHPLVASFPPQMLLGVNRRGLHLFQASAPRGYLHSVPLRDVAQFGSTGSAVFFKLRLAGGGGRGGHEEEGGEAQQAAPPFSDGSGPLHTLQFGTPGGEDVCLALQAHIDDIIRRRAVAAAAGAARAEEERDLRARRQAAAGPAAAPVVEAVTAAAAAAPASTSSSLLTTTRLAALAAERDAAVARAEAAEAALAASGRVAPATTPSSKDEEDAAAASRARIATLEGALAAETVARKRAVNAAAAAAGRVRVVARVRPPLGGPGGTAPAPGAPPPPPCCLAFPDALTLAHGPVRGGGNGSTPHQTKAFDFDGVLPPSATQADVWAAVDGDAMVRAALDGDNVCLLAYGQTGAGKTHSVWGEPATGAPGLAPRAAAALFTALGKSTASGGRLAATVTASVLELYCDDLRDLLAEKSTSPSRGRATPGAAPSSGGGLEVKRDPATGAVSVPGATSARVTCAPALEALLASAVARRATAPTAMNAASSRSHLIMTIALEVVDGATGRAAAGKLTFVDLAGSERIKRSGSEAGPALAEATSVNKSLSALGDVAAALAEGAPHIPYRNSRLTMLLADCLGGSARAALLLAASPDPADLSETARALEYGARVRTITNAPARAAWSAEAARLRREVEVWKGRYASAVGDGAAAGVGLEEVANVKGGGPPPAIGTAPQLRGA